MSFSHQSEPSHAGRQQRFAEAYTVLREAITAHAFPGCAFGLLAEGEVQLLDALGSFTYDASGSPAVTPDTLFDVASLTKLIKSSLSEFLNPKTCEGASERSAIPSET